MNVARVAIVGAGAVGATTAYSLLISGTAILINNAGGPPSGDFVIGIVRTGCAPSMRICLPRSR